MKKYFYLLIFVCFALFAFFLTTQGKEKVKVACIGNSITEGFGLKKPQKDSYPAVLQRLLGDDYIVYNFGVSARTMLNKGDHPYMKEEKYKQALALNPDIVVIKLGTNDSKPHNWKYKEEYVKDMETMVSAFRDLPSKPQIYLCLPVPVVATTWGINDSTLVTEIIPNVKKIAAEKGLKLIDLRTPLLDYPQYFPDNVHPNENGALIIAEEVYEALIEQ